MRLVFNTMTFSFKEAYIYASCLSASCWTQKQDQKSHKNDSILQKGKGFGGYLLTYSKTPNLEMPLHLKRMFNASFMPLL